MFEKRNMRGDGLMYAGIFNVLNSMLRTSLANNFADFRIVHVGNLGK